MPLFSRKPDIEKLKAKRDVEGLIKVLEQHKDSYTCIKAVRALDEIGNKQSIAALGIAAKNYYPDVRREAGMALVKLGASAVKPLLSMMPYDHLASDCLIKVGTPAVEPVCTALLEYLKTPVTSNLDPHFQMIHILGEIGDARATETLVACLNNSNDDICRWAAKGLDKLRWQPDNDKQLVIYWLIKEDVDRCVKMGSAAVEPLIANLKHENGKLRGLAAKALGQIGDTRAVEPLTALLQDNGWYYLVYSGDKSENIRNVTAEALKKLGHTP